jgi:polyphosphate kinase 2 (PPK2 family)
LKLGGKDYDKELARLHVELFKLQEWVIHKGLKVCILFEGRDGGGKGGTIKAITQRVMLRIDEQVRGFVSLQCARIPLTELSVN